jgi:hypothetical protein
MIVSKKHDLGFVHIAKCAGSTVRQQLRDQDDAGAKFYRIIEHPDLGRLNGNHIPLSLLRSGFPDDFRALTEVTSYTLTRAPIDRFISGVSQYIRDKGREPGEISAADIRAEAALVIAYLEGLKGHHDVLHTLFIPQRDYVYLDRQKVISHVYAMEHLDQFFDTLDTRHGLSLIRDSVWNPTVTYRYPALTNTLKKMKNMGQTYLPMKAYVALREIGVRTLTSAGVPALNETLLSSDIVTSFVHDYYADDFRIYQTALDDSAS